LLGVVLAAILLFNRHGLRDDASVSRDRSTESPADASAADPVSLTIVFDDGRRQVVDDVEWHSGMTVRDAMQGAPDVSFLQQGNGASAFLTSIGGVANEGAGGRNWMYSVNGERADRSYGIYELAPGDHVLWTFTPPQ
jgi:hypothetical protein